MDAKLLARIEYLERQNKELRETTHLLWGACKAALRGLTHLAAGDAPGMVEILKAGAEEGLVNFDAKMTRDRFGNEELARMHEEIAAHYRRNQTLYKFQQSFIGEKVVKSREGGSSRATPRNDGPEIA